MSIMDVLNQEAATDSIQEATSDDSGDTLEKAVLVVDSVPGDIASKVGIVKTLFSDESLDEIANYKELHEKAIGLRGGKVEPVDELDRRVVESLQNTVIIPPKKGETITFINSQKSPPVLEGVILSVAKMPLPHNYLLCLVRVKGAVCVVMHKHEWFKMADGVRSVQSSEISEVEGFMNERDLKWLAVSSCDYGGSKGLSLEYAANRLWKHVIGKRLKAKDLF